MENWIKWLESIGIDLEDDERFFLDNDGTALFEELAPGRYRKIAEYKDDTIYNYSA